ncbi:hypothetical protein PMAYCL1PPCAC_33265, partial [Pristionchus mayeri]
YNINYWQISRSDNNDAWRAYILCEKEVGMNTTTQSKITTTTNKPNSADPNPSTSTASSSRCPFDFDIVDGECRGLYQKVQKVRKSESLAIAIEKCREIDQHSVIIRNIDDHVYWTSNRWGKFDIVIGLTCNESSKRWEWIDGSPLLFKPRQYDKALDKGCTAGHSWYQSADGLWKI